MKMNTKSYGLVDLDTLGRTQLLHIHSDLTADLVDINGQIDDAKREYRLTGKRSDPQWLGNWFIDIAREELPSDTFDMLLTRAIAAYKGASPQEHA